MPLRGWNGFVVIASACASVFLYFAAARALMRAGLYRLPMIEQASVGNTGLKTGGGYTLLGSTSQLGYGTLAGGKYSVNWGTMNSWSPPQGNVSAAHAYPNPCHLRSGCVKVVFTKLTLQATVKIYTVSGELVRTIPKSGGTDNVEWDLKNSAGRQAASGLYIYLVQGENDKKRGKLIITR